MIRTTSAALALASALALAAPAGAGDLSLSFSKHGKHGSVSIQLGGRGAPGYVCGPSYRTIARPIVRCAPVWVPARYEIVVERVWVPAACENVWIEPEYETRFSYGCRTERIVRPGHWERVTTPGHYEERHVKVWRPGHWSTSG